MNRINFNRLINSFNHAFRGVIHLLTDEQNARIHSSIAIFVGIMAYILGVSRVEATILFMAIIMVFAMEIMNTAIEKVCDLFEKKDNEKIKFIKDGMAGAVLIASVIAVVVALLIFIPYIRKI